MADGARHGHVHVAGGEAIAAEAEVPAGEEHHGGRPQAAGEAGAVRPAAARVHVRRRGRLRRARLAATELIAGRPRRGRGLLELRVEGHGGGLLREGLRLPRRRLAAEARQPLLEFRAAPRLALRLQRLLPEPARRGSLCRDKQRPVMAPHPIGHRPPELLALLFDESVELLILPLHLSGKLVGERDERHGRRRVAQGFQAFALLLLLLLLLLIQCQAKASGHECRRRAGRRRRYPVVELRHVDKRRRLLRLEREQIDQLLLGRRRRHGNGLPRALIPPINPTRSSAGKVHLRRDSGEHLRPGQVHLLRPLRLTSIVEEETGRVLGLYRHC